MANFVRNARHTANEYQRTCGWFWLSAAGPVASALEKKLSSPGRRE